MTVPHGLQQVAWIISSLSGICSIQSRAAHVITRSFGVHFHIEISFIQKKSRILIYGLYPCEQDGVTCLSWIGDSKYVAAGCADGKVRIWDSLSGDCVQTFSGHRDVIQSVAVSADKKFLVSGSLDGTARVFDIPEFQ